MADEEVGTDTEVVPGDPAGGTTDAAAVATETTPQTTQPAEEQFIDPATLPEELKAHWKRMHGTYNKRLGEIRASKADLDFLAQYRGNPDYARQVLQQEAARLGLTLAQANAAADAARPNGTAQPAGDVPAQLVEAIKGRLSPELQWMAPSLAAAQWEAHRMTALPLVQREQQRERATRQAQYEEMASALGERAPGWEQHEDDMLDLLGFIQSPALTHKRWGSKLDLLLNMVTGGAAATNRAIERMGAAAKARTATGVPGRTTVPNVHERVRQAKTPGDAWRIAAEEAERELKASGVTVPE